MTGKVTISIRNRMTKSRRRNEGGGSGNKSGGVAFNVKAAIIVGIGCMVASLFLSMGGISVENGGVMTGITAEEMAISSTTDLYNDQPLKPQSISVRGSRVEWLRMVTGRGAREMEMLENMMKRREGNGHVNAGNGIMRVTEGFIQGHSPTLEEEGEGWGRYAWEKEGVLMGAVEAARWHLGMSIWGDDHFGGWYR